MKRTGTLFVAGAALLACLLANPWIGAQEKKGADPRKDKQPPSSLSQPSLAIQLALEGQKRKSPTLMLAAIELLAPLKESARSIKDVKQEQTGETTGKGMSLNVADLVDQARDFAKGDKEMSALLDERLKSLTSRGLIYNQGKNLPSINVKGLTFKILWTSDLQPGQEYKGNNLIFEANRPADVVVIGDVGASLDMLVSDNLGALGRRVGDLCAVSWNPITERSVNVSVINTGRFATKIVVLASW